MSPKNPVNVDGVTIDAGSQEAVDAIEALKSKIANDNHTLQRTRDEQIAAKDREISRVQADIDQVKDRIRTQDQLVIDLGDLRHLCATRMDIKPAGLTIIDMKRDALRKKLGDAAVEGRSDGYVEARFDMVLESCAMATPDPFRDALKSGIVRTGDDRAAADQAYADYVASLTNWRDQ